MSTILSCNSIENKHDVFRCKMYVDKCKYNDKYRCKCKCTDKWENRHCFLEYKNFKDDLTECKCLYCNKNYYQKAEEKLKEQFLNFLAMITISLFYCCEKVFILTNIWMIGKKSMKHYHL